MYAHRVEGIIVLQALLIPKCFGWIFYLVYVFSPLYSHTHIISECLLCNLWHSEYMLHTDVCKKLISSIFLSHFMLYCYFCMSHKGFEEITVIKSLSQTQYLMGN